MIDRFQCLFLLHEPCAIENSTLSLIPKGECKFITEIQEKPSNCFFFASRHIRDQVNFEVNFEYRKKITLGGNIDFRYLGY